MWKLSLFIIGKTDQLRSKNSDIRYVKKAIIDTHLIPLKLRAKLPDPSDTVKALLTWFECRPGCLHGGNLVLDKDLNFEAAIQRKAIKNLKMLQEKNSTNF